MTQTFLVDFIETQAVFNDYSERKNRCLFNSLKFNSLRGLAENQKISYDVVRRWNTQTLFKQRRDALARQFAIELAGHIKHAIGEGETGIFAHLQKQPALLNKSMSAYLYAGLEDFHDYSKLTKKHLTTLARKEQPDSFVAVLLRLIAGDLRAESLQLISNVTPNNRFLFNLFLEKTRVMMKRNHLTVKERKVVGGVLSLAGKTI